MVGNIIIGIKNSFYLLVEGMYTLDIFLMKKEVDKSLLNEGMTIPQDLHEKFLEALDITLQKGDTAPIRIVVNGKSFEDIKLYYPKFSEKYSNRDVIQIRYTTGQPLAQTLRTIFSHSTSLIADQRESLSENRQRIVIPENEKEFIDIYAIGRAALEFKCYSKLQNEESVIYSVLERMLNEYVEAKSELFADHPLGIFLRKDVPEKFYSTGIIDREHYLISGSVGQGNWAAVPWICIFDRNITTTATKGVYIVYLLSQDGKFLYLTLNQGCTDIKKTHTKRETISIMKEEANRLVEVLDNRGFRHDHEISLGENLTDLAEYYQEGTIFYKKYDKKAIPLESELRTDLMNMIQIYKDYVAFLGGQEFSVEDGVDTALSVKDIIEKVKSYIGTKGFSYEPGLIENFYLSLKAKPFVILAGISGTGKTRLVKLFAEAVGANSENGRYKMISVRPDWSDSSDLLGHRDLNGKFVPGSIIDFVKNAEMDTSHPYFLCFDEMNLARVEYYLSDVLSVIETRDLSSSGKIISEVLVSEAYYGIDKVAAEKYGILRLPENLYIIGTVNMDETTFPFSRKVLDRANTMEFSTVNLMPNLLEETEEVLEPIVVPNDFLKTEYLLLKQCMREADYVNDICFELETINKILQLSNAHIGYRVRDEIVFYMLNNKHANLLEKNDALDNEIMQKILPRIQGSNLAIKSMLCALFEHCAGDYEGYQIATDDVSSKMLNVVRNSNCKYQRSAEKIAFMVRRYEEDGFTSYWL